MSFLQGTRLECGWVEPGWGKGLGGRSHEVRLGLCSATCPSAVFYDWMRHNRARLVLRGSRTLGAGLNISGAWEQSAPGWGLGPQSWLGEPGRPPSQRSFSAIPLGSLCLARRGEARASP